MLVLPVPPHTTERFLGIFVCALLDNMTTASTQSVGVKLKLGRNLTNPSSLFIFMRDLFWVPDNLFDLPRKQLEDAKRRKLYL